MGNVGGNETEQGEDVTTVTTIPAGNSATRDRGAVAG